MRIQHRLRTLLDTAAGPAAMVESEIPYRPLREYEAWFADLAYMPRTRWDSIEVYLFGAPDLVIEVLSPSDTTLQMRDKRKLCLANGALEFWVVDPEQRDVEVSTPDGRSVIYSAGQQIPLFFAAGSHLDVEAIFE